MQLIPQSQIPHKKQMKQGPLKAPSPPTDEFDSEYNSESLDNLDGSS